MKRKILGVLAGLGLMTLAPLAAHADGLYIGVDGGYAPPPAVYTVPAPAYYGYNPYWEHERWERHRWHEEQRERAWHEHEWRVHHGYGY